MTMLMIMFPINRKIHHHGSTTVKCGTAKHIRITPEMNRPEQVNGKNPASI
jgi:hypothetical protein